MACHRVSGHIAAVIQLGAGLAVGVLTVLGLCWGRGVDCCCLCCPAVIMCGHLSWLFVVVVCCLSSVVVVCCGHLSWPSIIAVHSV